jgi:CheY-like chemotaxis protein
MRRISIRDNGPGLPSEDELTARGAASGDRPRLTARPAWSSSTAPRTGSSSETGRREALRSFLPFRSGSSAAPVLEEGPCQRRPSRGASRAYSARRPFQAIGSQPVGNSRPVMLVQDLEELQPFERGSLGGGFVKIRTLNRRRRTLGPRAASGPAVGRAGHRGHRRMRRRSRGRAGHSKRHPGLVFLDVQIPEIDGFGVIERIGVENAPWWCSSRRTTSTRWRRSTFHAVDLPVEAFRRGPLREGPRPARAAPCSLRGAARSTRGSSPPARHQGRRHREGRNGWS